MEGAAGVGGAASALLERESELASLAAFVDATAGGGARLVIVHGRAGIGKTQLLAAGRRRAAEAGLRVLSARGGELEREYAFGVVRQLFEPVLIDPAERDRLLTGAATPAATVFEWLEDAAGEADHSFAVLHGLYWLTVNLSAERPLLLAVDDLHWCDRPSLRFLAFLVRRLEGLPVLALASLRPAEPGVDAALLAELLGDPLVSPLHPSPLSEGAVGALVRRRLGENADDAFADACHAATGGNPLLLNELLKALESEGVSPDAVHVATVRELGPRAASRAVLVRLARLRGEAVAVARAVAILGDGADLGTVAAFADVEPRTAAAAATELARAEIMRSEQPLGFVHPLVAGAVYHDIPPGEREVAHERAARLLEEAGASAEQVAAHLLAMPPTGEQRFISTLRRAAGQALHKGAPESAVAYLTRALAEPPATEHAGLVLLELGVAEALTNGPAATEHLRRAYEILDDPLLKANAAQHLGRALLFTGDAAASAEVAREVAATLPQELVDLRRSFRAAELGTVLFGAGDFRTLHGIELPSDDAEGLGAKLLTAVVAVEAAYSGEPAERCAELALRALEGGELIAADNGGFFVMGSIVTLVCGEHPQTDAVWQEARADAHRRGSLFAVGAIHLWYGFTLLRRGALAEARDELEAASSDFAGWGYGALAQHYVRTFLALTLLEQGDAAAARRMLERGGEPTDVAADGTRYWLVSRLALEVAEERYDAAVATAERIEREHPDVVNVAFNPWRGLAAEAHDRLGHHEQALALATEEVELARRWGAHGELGRTLRVLGTIEGERGIEHLREAVELLEQSPARLEYAKALAALGSALRRHRKPADARDPLRRALELADACGAAGLADDVRSELYAAGARPRSSAASGVGSLTAAEHRVVKLAAEGQTNREIAQVLFITPKTVEVHLSNAYRKLGISSRRELATALVA